MPLRLSRLDTILVNDPLQGAAVAEAIGEHVRGNPGQGERIVDHQGGLVLAELHALYAVRERPVVRLDPLQVIRLKVFVFEMQPGKLFAGGSERLKVRGKRNARQLTFQIIGELLPIAGMVQQAVDVIENVPFGYGGVAVMVVELLKPPVGDVLTPIRAVFVVDPEGKALVAISKLASLDAGQVSGIGYDATLNPARYPTLGTLTHMERFSFFGRSA